MRSSGKRSKKSNPKNHYVIDTHNKRTKSKKKNDQNKEKNTEQKNKKKFSKLKKVLIAIAVLIVILCIVFAGIVIGIFSSDKYKITENDLVGMAGNTKFYDKDGNFIQEVSGDENRKIVSYDQIPQNMIDAFISIEDERFYKHHGVDIKRTAAAIVSYVFNRGSSSFGGSTITQQLIKNIKQDKDDSNWAGIQRKIREIARARSIEKMLDKKQILEMYLNIIFMGGTNYGVATGASYYFDKDISDLDLAECAFIAGINHSPNSYNPYDTDNQDAIKEKIQKRTKTVLNKMKELNKVTEEEYNEAIAKVDAGLTFSKGEANNSGMTYHEAAAINQLANQIAEENDLTYEAARAKVFSGGYNVYTTVDPAIQSRMEEEYHKDSTYVKKSNKVEGAHTQSAMVIIDQEHGYVVGTVGGLGTDTDSTGRNRATQSKRQPGSAIKPIAVIAPALEKGIINLGTVYDDSPTTFGNYTPKNSTGYQGLTTIRHALEASSNIVELKVMSELGPKNSIEFLRQMGVSSLTTAAEDSKNNDEILSLALGGSYNGISVLEMAAAYATIANDGEYITPVFYTKVEDSNGNVVYEAKQEKRKVLSTANAYLMKNVLTETVVGSSGTAKSCAISGVDVGAKTGTTSDNYDRWLCGITPYYTAATWYGYDYNESVSFSGNPAAKIWAAIMKDIHKDKNAKFEQPTSVVTAKICLDSGKSATSSCSRTETEYFVSGAVPAECTGHEHATVCTESGKLANEYCPSTKTKTFLTTPDKEQTELWKTDSNGKYSKISGTCTIHTKQTAEEVNKKNEVVSNTTSNDPVVEETKKVTVPSVIGKTQSAATSELKALGLKVNVTTSEDKTKSNGVVLKQSINSGNKVIEGTEVTITVNKLSTDASDNKNTTNETKKQ